jgi:hypothetical protein
MQKNLMTISAVIFTAVFILHLSRVIYSLPVIVGSYAVPMWLSVLGVFGTAVLAGLNWRYR